MSGDAARMIACATLVGSLAAVAALVDSKISVAVVCSALLALPAGLWLLGGQTRWVTAFLCAATLLPPLPFALGNAGPHPAVAVALLGVFAGLAYAREWQLQITSLTAAVLIFSGVIFCSVGLAALYSGPEIGLGSLIRALLFAIGVYVFLFTLCGPATTQPVYPAVRLLFAAAAMAALFACLDFYYQIPAPGGYSPQFVWLDSGVFRRAQGLFYEASTLGNFCAFFLVMIGVSIVRPPQERPVKMVWMVGGGVLLGAAVLLSYSRASVVNLLVSMGALWLLRKKRTPIWRPLTALFSSAALTCLACYLLLPQLFSAYLYRIWNSVAYSASSTNGVLSGRLDSWRTILRFLADNPWHLIFGVGYKTLPYSRFTGSAVIADNAYLSALAETGLIGLVALLFLLFAILRTGYMASRDADSRRSFFGTWTFCFWCGQAVQMFSGDLLTYWRVLPVYFWVLALAAR
jgi:O-antigen ligase